jgi:hypothetical protein
MLSNRHALLPHGHRPARCRTPTQWPCCFDSSKASTRLPHTKQDWQHPPIAQRRGGGGGRLTCKHSPAARHPHFLTDPTTLHGFHHQTVTCKPVPHVHARPTRYSLSTTAPCTQYIVHSLKHNKDQELQPLEACAMPEPTCNTLWATAMCTKPQMTANHIVELSWLAAGTRKNGGTRSGWQNWTPHLFSV